MSNIQKLYEIAEVPRIYSEFNNGREAIVENVFSPYKQLELIKLLSKKQYVYIIMSADKEYYLCTDNSFISGYNKQFDEALAMFINAYWQDLTPEEKQQVKGVLE